MLDNGDKQIRARMDALTGEVIRLWHALLAKSPATMATGLLALRCSASWKSVCMILSGCRDADELELCCNDAAALLRCMHDVCIQAEYIAAGDAAASMSADDLGRLFVEYEHVERHRLSTAAVKFPSELASIIRASPLRSEGEARNQAEFDRVAPNYPDKRHWYRGSLAELARKIGKEEEHYWYTTELHGSIHGGPLACRRGPPIQGASNILIIAVSLLRRVLAVVIESNGLVLSMSSAEMMRATAGDLLNPSKQPRAESASDSREN